MNALPVRILSQVFLDDKGHIIDNSGDAEIVY